MRTAISLLAALLVFGVFLANLRGTPAGPGPGNYGEAGSVRPELEYLKAVNSVAPPRDPQLLFLLMAQYSNANLQDEGAEFFSARLQEFGPRLTDAQEALYLSAIGLLRAQHASSVSLLHRAGYVKETIAILKQAKQLSGGKIFVVNWIAGIVHAELPGVFHQRNAAKAELAWCLENADKAPDAGWLREIYDLLGKLALAEGEQDKAQDYLRRSGYKGFERAITLITPFSEEAASGHAFSPRRISEIGPGRVYALSGFEFTEYYFVVSADRRELIGIDAGTRPDSAKAAYEALRAHAPGLPELTTVFITHAHWDHVGGHALFIEMPELGLMFGGDFLMPYLGAPFVEEGNLQGLLDTIDIVVEKHPRYLLHGHEPLTRNFGPAPMLAQLKTDLAWLREQVLGAIRRGDENAVVQQANLIPPDLLAGHPGAILPYLIMREHVIDRLYDQNVGYWQADLQGISHISRADRGEILVNYLGVSESRFAKALERMVADGKYELAASLLQSSGGRFARSGSVAKTERLIYRKLMEQYQNYDPFKFILYSAKAGERTPQMTPAK